MRILIAEDDPVSRKLLQITLSRWGFESVVCSDGKQALASLQAPDAPDVAVLDWMMPEIDGPEVCRRIRQAPSHHPKYIILLTAKVQRDDVVAGLHAGADDYVTKPFDPKELRARLNVGIRIIGLQKDLAAKVDALEVAMLQIAGHQQSQKLEAIGRLSSGVAHELNTPLQFIGDNVRFLQEAWGGLDPALRMLFTLPEALRSGAPQDELAAKIDALLLSGDIRYALKEVPSAVAQSLEGISRVTKIVRAMKDFSDGCDERKAMVDLNRAIDSTVTIARNEWKYVADVVTEFDQDLPQVFCLAAEIQQVVLNLLVNASQAIADVVGNSGQRGTITVSTAKKEGFVEIVVADSGKGIPEELREKIFEPFFTTKDVGKGTGQGLATARSVVVQQHYGKIWVESETGKGTSVFIQLPLNRKEENNDEPIGESQSPACR